MNDATIRIIVAGLSANGHDVSLSEFGKVVNSCRKLLQHAAQSALGGNKCDFLISHISHDSPLCLEMSPHSLVARPGVLIAQQLRDEEAKIRNGESDSMSDDALRAWEGVVDRFDKGKVSVIKIEADLARTDKRHDNLQFSADKEVVEAIKKTREQELSCLTSVMGKIKLINLHDRMFRVYPEVKNWNTVDVSLNDNQQPEVIKYIGQLVEVSGVGHYRARDALPYKMVMDSIHLLPSKEDSPTLLDMRGIAPGLTGNQSTQEYIRNLRAEWDR